MIDTRYAVFRYRSFNPDSSRCPTLGHSSRSTRSRTRLGGREAGQGLTEYAVLVSLVAVACIAAMAFFGGALQGRISSFVAAIAGESTATIEEGNKRAQSASKKLSERSKKIDGMKVNTDKATGEVIDSESLQ